MDDSFDIRRQQKKLYLDIKEKEADYARGQRDLAPCLRQTDELFQQQIASKEDVQANQITSDLALVFLQSSIVRKCASNYKIDTLVFNSKDFSSRVKLHYTSMFAQYGDKDSNEEDQSEAMQNLWQSIGEESRLFMNTVPTFNFINDTFTAQPIESVKKQKKQIIRDETGDLIKPKELKASDVSNQDVMITMLERTYSIFLQYYEKNQGRPIFYYEFVTNPSSFTRTVENIFMVSLLVKENRIEIFADKEGLPFIRAVEKRSKHTDETVDCQNILSITVKKWKDIIETFDIKQAKINPLKRKLV